MTREEAIKILKELPNSILGVILPFDTDFDYTQALDMAIKALEQETCEDCVSRQAVLAGINNWWGITMTAGEPTICDYIRELPPVTPTRKKGKWIEEPNCWLRCSCCNSHHPYTSIYAIRGSNYCPECGAEMESEQKC